MTAEEFNWWLLVIFIGTLALLGLIVLHNNANPDRSELDEVLMRNGEDE